MKKITLIAAALLAAGAAQAQAQKPATSGVYGEVGYSFVKLENSGGGISFDADVGVLRGLIGWEAHPNLAVEAMFGTGVSDDTVLGAKVEVTRTYGLYVKPKFALNSQFEVFGRLGYAESKIKASAGGGSASGSDSDFSWGVGASYNLTPQFYVSADYMSYYSKDGGKAQGPSINVGYRF